VRRQLKFRLGNNLPLKLAGYEEERLLFTLACESAREELMIVWQRSDEKGRVQVRSPFVEAGAQGPHKLARGYMPKTTYSAHHIADPSLRRAVAQFLDRERSYVDMETRALAEHAPFRREGREGERDS